MGESRVHRSIFFSIGFWLSWIFGSGLFGLSSAAWAEGRLATEPSSKCVRTSSDAYAPAVALTAASSQYSGQCLDTQTFRSVVEVSRDQAFIRVANLIHQNQYWIARVPLDPNVYDKAFFQIQRFPVVKGVEAAHVQLRIRLKAGQFFLLENQQDPSRKDQVQSVILSFEAGRPAGIDYNFAMGAFDNYVLVGRFASAEQRYQERSTTQTEQYELKLSATEISQLLQRGLARSERRGTREFYNTLKPNCTTELMDLFDELPRLQGRFSPFLTVLSPDPIARPSLEALTQRGILQGRVQNMNTELSGSFSGPDQSRPLPSLGPTELSFLPQVPGLPWTLVLAHPSTANLNPDEREALREIREKILTRIPLFIQGLGTVLMLNANNEDKAGVVLSYVFDKVQSELARSLRDMNGRLSKEQRTLGLYLVPYDSRGKAVSLEQIGIPAALPFQAIEAEVDPDNQASQGILWQVAEGSRQASDRGAGLNSPFYLRALILKVQLEKDHSSSTAQVLVGLKPMSRPFTMANSQVVFKEMRIPQSTDRASRSVLLLTQRQEAFSSAPGKLQIEFGAEGGIAGSLDARKFAQFQIFKGADCTRQTQSVPTLIGVFGERPLQNGIVNSLLQGKPVSFGVFSAEVDLRTQTVDDMKIQVGTWPLRCLSVSQVDQQFEDEANSMINKYKSEVGFDGLLGKIFAQILQ